MTTGPTQKERKALAREQGMGWACILAVGVGKQIKDSGFAGLKTCVADAIDVAQTFKDTSSLMADPDRVNVLTSETEGGASRGSIIGALKRLADDAEEGERLIFFFSGHGWRIENALYLVPQDAYSPDDKHAHLAFADVEAILNKSKAKQKIIILDACLSGPDTSTFKAPLASVSEKFFTDYLEATRGLVRLSAATSDTVAHTQSPNPKHSLFTHFLLTGLRGEPDALEDGRLLTVSSLFQYISVQTRKYAKSAHISQKPSIKQSVDGVIVLGDFEESARQTRWLAGATAAARSIFSNPPVKQPSSPDKKSPWRASRGLATVVSLVGFASTLVVMAVPDSTRDELFCALGRTSVCLVPIITDIPSVDNKPAQPQETSNKPLQPQESSASAQSKQKKATQFVATQQRHTLDNDKDGVQDAADKCPTEPSLGSADGCPQAAMDRDGDGIADKNDRCPDQAEDYDSFQDNDGCPELDNDHDAIMDATDKCPTEPGLITAHGCPDRGQAKVPVEGAKSFIREKIFFADKEASIRPESIPLLQQLAQVLRASPQIELVRVEGHSAEETTEEYNLQLSSRRAAVVHRWLVEAGIAAKRLEVFGYGETRPVDTNETDEGRANNRRVEFRVLKLKQP